MNKNFKVVALVGAVAVALSGQVSAFSAGTGADDSGFGATAVGDNSSATSDHSTALGQSSIASGGQATAVGKDAQALGGFSSALGRDAQATELRTTALGMGTRASAFAATAVGNNASAIGESSTALGTATETSGSFSVAIGNGSTDNGLNGVVSFGSDDRKRRLINVGMGDVSITSTDAVNGSQLYAVQETADAALTTASIAYAGTVANAEDIAQLNLDLADFAGEVEQRETALRHDMMQGDAETLAAARAGTAAAMAMPSVVIKSGATKGFGVAAAHYAGESALAAGFSFIPTDPNFKGVIDLAASYDTAEEAGVRVGWSVSW